MAAVHDPTGGENGREGAREEDRKADDWEEGAKARYEQGGRECGRKRARRGGWVGLERSCRKGGRRV